MSIETLTSVIVREMPDINKWQRDFFHHHLGLFLALRGWYTYLNVERYGQKNELVVGRVFDVFANIPNITKNHPALQDLYNLGKFAA